MQERNHIAPKHPLDVSCHKKALEHVMLSGDAVGERINQAHWKRGRDHVMLSEDAVGERHYESEDVVMSC